MVESQTSSNKSLFSSFAGMIQRMCKKVENISGRVPEIIASAIYIVARIFMSFFHEPWYDEAVAWQIARCASIKDILFTIPHYEGHPPLWHIILLPFAKLGAPYELSLCIVSLIFAGTASCLIIWKSPFPRIIRLLLPFTYFFFYQYAVITRPYCLMMLAFVLLAMAHKKRNIKPGNYVLALMLLCLTSGYGILIAGGLAIVWILEMWDHQNIIVFFKKMIHDKRTVWLLVLLVFAVLLIAIIMPRSETAAISGLKEKFDVQGAIRGILYMLFALPSEVSMTSIYAESKFLKSTDIPWMSLIATCMVGLIIWFFLIKYGKRKKTVLTLVVPYVMFAMFAAIVYAWNHHIGIGLYIFVFWFWITLNEDCKNDMMEKESSQMREIITGVILFFGTLAMIISLVWNVSSCVQDVLYSYSIGKNEAKYIKENGLDNYNIMAGFTVDYIDGEVSYMDLNEITVADNIAPYFDHNIFYNFNNGEDSLNYSTHRKLNKEEEKEVIKNWQKQRPDVLYLYPSIDLIYEDINLYEYKLVYQHKHYKIWKGFLSGETSKIYAHEDLIEKLGLETYSGETFAKMQLYN